MNKYPLKVKRNLRCANSVHDYGPKSCMIFFEQPTSERERLLIYPNQVGYQEIGPKYYNEVEYGNYYMLNYTVSGRGKFIYKDEKEYDIKAGDLIFMHAYNKRVLHPLPGQPWTFYYIHIYGSEPQKFLEYFNKKVGHVASDYPPESILPGLKSILDLGQFQSPGREYEISLTLYDMFIKMVRFLDSKPNAEPFQIESVVSYINENYTKKIALKDIAHNANYSTAYLEKLFKQHFGITPMQYLSNLRLYKAQQLLLATNSTLAEIAAQTGLPDERALMYLFKKNIGMTPTQYKQSILKYQSRKN